MGRARVDRLGVGRACLRHGRKKKAEARGESGGGGHGWGGLGGGSGGGFADGVVDEAELFDGGGGEDEGVGVGEAHAAVEVVEDVGEGEPVVDDLGEALEVGGLGGLGFHGGLVGA